MYYTARITREGKHWLAEFIDAPGCQTFAGSEAELVAAASEALEGWLEAHLEGGKVPNRPQARIVARRGARLLRVVVPSSLAVALMIRWSRAQAELTQAQLAKRAGVSQQQIAKLERAGENPTIGTLEKVARAIGCQLEVKIARAT